MKRSNVITSVIPILLLLFFAGCESNVETPSNLPTGTTSSNLPVGESTQESTTIGIEQTPTQTSTPAPTVSEDLVTSTATATEFQVVLPAATPLEQEAHEALAELMRSNGDCLGTCLVGIWPEKHSVQEAVDLMAQWGAVVSSGSFFGLHRAPLNEDAVISISVGTWEEKFVSIDTVLVSIRGNSDSIIQEEVWTENQDSWRGFSLPGFIDAYGVPSYVGFDFRLTIEQGEPLEGRTIGYGLEIQFEQSNLSVLRSGIGYYDGESVTICPDIDPHYLYIELYPERPLSELQAAFSVTYEKLTDGSLESLAEVVSSGQGTNYCFVTTLEKIAGLQGDFP